MYLRDWANIATIIQSAAVVVSVFFIWYELRQNRKLTQAANTQALAELISPFNMKLFQDREMTKLWYKGAERFEEMDEIDQHRYKELLTWWLILHENIYYQYRRGLIDKTVYTTWNRDLQTFVTKQDLGRHWDMMKSSYQIEFAQHVSQLISQNEIQPKLDEGKESQTSGCI